MISSLLAGLVLAAQTPAVTEEAANPNEAVCRPTGQFSDGQIINIGLSCPSVETDPDGFVAYLTSMLDAMPNAVAIPQVENVSINDTIRFVHDGAGWRLSEPTPLIRVAALYPLQAARNGWSGACVTRFHLSGPMAIEIDETVCIRENRGEPRTTRLFTEEMEAALGQFIWLPFPGREAACGTLKTDFQISRLQPSSEEPPSLMPDPDDYLSCP